MHLIFSQYVNLKLREDKVRLFVYNNYPDAFNYFERVGWDSCNFKPSYISTWKGLLKKGKILSTAGVGQKQLDAAERAIKAGIVH